MSLIESMTRRMTETGGGVTFAPTDLAGTAPALRDTLTAEIKKRYGGDAVWNIGGEDVAPLFADRLIKHGLINLDQFTGINRNAGGERTMTNDPLSGNEVWNESLPSATLKYGDKNVGYFGRKEINPSLKWGSNSKTVGDPQVASWVNTKKGGADIYAVQDPATGQVKFVPMHVSSNDASKVRAELGKALSVMAAPIAAWAAPALAGTAAGAALGTIFIAQPQEAGEIIKPFQSPRR